MSAFLESVFGTVAVVLTACGLLGRLVVVPCFRGYRWAKRRVELIVERTERLDALATIRTEVAALSGSMLGIAVANRVELDRLGVEMATFRSELAPIGLRLDHLTTETVAIWAVLRAAGLERRESMEGSHEPTT